MKNYLIYFLAFGLLFSCSEDDTDTVIDESFLSGTWSLTEITSENGTVTLTSDVLPLPVSGNYSVSGENITSQIIFTVGGENEDNTFTSSGGFTLIGEATFTTQDPIRIEEDVTEFLGEGTWTVENNELTITSSGTSETFPLTGNENTIRLTFPIDETVEENGVTLDISGTQIFVFTKN